MGERSEVLVLSFVVEAVAIAKRNKSNTFDCM
jgi:hypothetical protein